MLHNNGAYKIAHFDICIHQYQFIHKHILQKVPFQDI